LVNTYPRSSLVPQARYWAARAEQLGGAGASAVAGSFQEVIRGFPGSFYALLAATRLRDLAADCPPPFSERPATAQTAVPGELTLAVALAKAGLFRDAEEEILERVSSVRATDAAYAYGSALQQLGDFGNAYALGARLLWGAAYGRSQPGALALLYPLAYRDAVEREAKARNIDPYFTWSIMRRESAFRPDVTSAANARGLLQLLPQSASAVARAIDEPDPNAADLYAPSLNIHLASAYLSELFKSFNHPALVAAAYNASPEAVRRWMGANGKMPLDLFVEMIPFKETRGYVKQVVADYQIYSGLYGTPGCPRVELSLPLAPPVDAR
jgi:soluble lytic murein transglycosylase